MKQEKTCPLGHKHYEGNGIRLDAFRRGGYYILRISYYRVTPCNGLRQYNEKLWTAPVEKRFVTKENANAYFRKIRETHKGLNLIGGDELC